MSTFKNRKLSSLPEEVTEIPLVVSLIRFHQKERARRSRQIVHRRATQLNEVRDHVLRRRLEKGQTWGCGENEESVEAVAREGWERTLKSEAILEALVRQIKDRATKTPNLEAKQDGVAETVDGGKERKDNGERGGKGSTRPKKRKTKKKFDKAFFLDTQTAVLKRPGLEDELATLYTEPSYPSRFRLYKDIARRTCGGKVWTWEDLMNGDGERKNEGASAASSPPDAHGIRTKAPKRVACRSQGRGREVSLPDFPIPKRVSLDTLKAIYQEVRDEEREQEMKFLEMEVRMTPFIVQTGILDSDPEFTAELEKTIVDAAASHRDFERKKRQMKKAEAAMGSEGRGRGAEGGGSRRRTKRGGQGGGERGAVHPHVPQATRERAVRRALFDQKRHNKQQEFGFEWDEESDAEEEEGERGGDTPDPTLCDFLPSQASSLQRAEDRQRDYDEEDEARWKGFRRQRWQRRRRRWRRRQGCGGGGGEGGGGVHGGGDDESCLAPHPSRETLSVATRNSATTMNTTRIRRRYQHLTHAMYRRLGLYGYTSSDDDSPSIPTIGVITSDGPKGQMIPLERGGYSRSFSTSSSSLQDTPRSSSLRTRSLSGHSYPSQLRSVSQASSYSHMTSSLTDGKTSMSSPLGIRPRRRFHRRSDSLRRRAAHASSSGDEDWARRFAARSDSGNADSNSDKNALPPIFSQILQKPAFPGSSVMAKPTYLPSMRNCE